MVNMVMIGFGVTLGTTVWMEALDVTLSMAEMETIH